MAFKVSHLRVYVGYLHQTLRRTRISKVGRLVASIFAHLGKALSFLPRGMGADGAGLLPRRAISWRYARWYIPVPCCRQPWKQSAAQSYHTSSLLVVALTEPMGRCCSSGLTLRGRSTVKLMAGVVRLQDSCNSAYVYKKTVPEGAGYGDTSR